ncbi:MAG: hypothetical protein OQJ84_02025, partial [Xanthomonadales bacterium]|nr:hypothetical protein [Xanthomonadales bacterium]
MPIFDNLLKYDISNRVRALYCILICFGISPVYGQAADHLPVTIFGDGDPYNGVEDSREPIMRGSYESDLPGAGAVACDGQVRGTAMVLDTREMAPGLEGVVLATAAHVLFDLERKRRFRDCEFQFLALGALPGYTAKIDLDQLVSGDFDPARATTDIEFGEGDWAFVYVPRPWKNYRPGQSLQLREFPFSKTEAFQQEGGEFRLIALDASSAVISESFACTLTESRIDDLGGGVWRGQLLDDCDSGGGASGGGIITVYKGQRYLVGLRTGSHWSGDVFPAAEYPAGPPAGSTWDPHFNTNFARAID